MIEARVIADSIAPNGTRLVTLECTYPYFIHGQVMATRVFSRNAASSRAIPVKKMIERVRNNIAMPSYWARNQRGMEAISEIDEDKKKLAIERWLRDAEQACRSAEYYAGLGVHKAIANRPVMPYMHMTTLISSTQWANHENLRIHHGAQQEYQLLATLMRFAMQMSEPTLVKEGAWHLPFWTQADAVLSIQDQIRVCVARCARVSLLNHEGIYSVEDDLILFYRLVSERPPHSSPLEHVATPLSSQWDAHSNFVGWEQFRGIFEAEIGWDSRS